MKTYLVVLAVCNALDAGSTVAVHRAGVSELWPWMPTKPGKVIAVRASITLGSVIGLVKLDRAGHPTLARRTAVWTSVVECGAAALNTRLLKRGEYPGNPPPVEIASWRQRERF